MRIALCFSGQIRTGCYAAENIKRFIGEHLPICDIFVHTWDFNMEKRSAETDGNGVTNSIGDDDANFKKIWNPVSMIVESYDMAIQRMEIERGVPACPSGWPAYRTNGVSDRWTPLYYSWYRSILLKRDHELLNGFKYDLVVKLRPDVVYPRKSRLAQGIDIWSADPARFYTDIKVVGTRIDDVLWYASSDVMDRASCYWLAKLKNPSADYTHHTYMAEQGIELGDTSHGYAPLRPRCIDLGLDPLTQWGKIYSEDIRLNSQGHMQWNDKPVTVEEWININQTRLDSY